MYQDMMDYDYWSKGTTNEMYADALLDIVTDPSRLSGVGATDDFNDDQGWWMLAMLRAYQVYGHEEFLTQAAKQWKQIQQSSQTSNSSAGSAPNQGGLARTLVITSNCDVDGAVYWEQSKDSGFTAISTNLFAQTGAWLYAFTKDEQYREGADKALGWLRRVMLNPKTGTMVVDSITPNTCSKNAGSLTYNTGNISPLDT